MNARDTHCKSDACGAPIEFAIMPNGHAHPVDPGIHMAGNIATWDEGGVQRGRYITRAEPLSDVGGEVPRMSHFATCKAAHEHRRQRGGRGDGRSMSTSQRNSARAQHAPRR